MTMNGRRGHGKLRLTSRKYFKPKPKRSSKSSVASIPALLTVTLPLSAYTDAPLTSMDILNNRLKKCEAIPSGNSDHLKYLAMLSIFYFLGWTNEVQNKELYIYKIIYVRSGPEVLTVHEDFTWMVLYRRYIVNPDSCSLLRTMSSEMNSGMLFVACYTLIQVWCMLFCIVSKVIKLVKLLCTSEICEGNPDERFLDSSIQKSLKNKSSKFL